MTQTLKESPIAISDRDRASPMGRDATERSLAAAEESPPSAALFKGSVQPTVAERAVRVGKHAARKVVLKGH